jgi:ATP-dependent Clp protease ATP-binding subunit ClpC
MLQFKLSAHVVRRNGLYRLTPVCGGLLDWTIESRDLTKARERAIERLRKEIPKLPRTLLPRIAAVQGRKLERLRLQFNVRGEDGKLEVTGVFPVIVEPRLASEERVLTIAYHPLRPAEWFELDPDKDLGEQVQSGYARVFAEYTGFDWLRAEPLDKLSTLSFNAAPPSLLDLIKKQQDERMLFGGGGGGDLSSLLRVASNQTARAAEGRLDAGMPRSPFRERLAGLLCGPSKSPVLVVGPPGCGKSTLITQTVHDLLAADNFASHRNLDRVHNVWRLQGRHIIAGMMYVGQWEGRCVALLERARERKMLLWVDDLHAWPRLGRSTSSERSFTDFFRAPLARRSLIAVAEVTVEQLALLERDAPAFTSAFARVYVEPSDSAETLSMMLHEARQLEAELEVAFDPRTYSKIRELSGSLLSASAFPGKALEPLKTLARETAARPREDGERTATPADVVQLFSRQTGLPEVLLSAEAPLERESLRQELEQQIMGQGVALDAACDLILGIRAGVTARGRPYGVFLFTGPTGTGKTELAKCIAEYLYGEGSRLVRFDMGELNTPLAPERLIGSQWEPEGQLTRAVRAQPFCVLLFDEIEKAHPSVLNLLLQLLDDGRLTDASGFVADFTHAVVIMTSNLGAGARRVGGFAEDLAAVGGDISRAVREFFPPELFNRIDRVVPFDPLSRADAESIARKELGKLAARPGLAERNIFLRFSPAVVRRVVDEAYQPEYGARALKRYIDKHVGDLIAATITSEAAAELRLFYLHVAADARLAIRAESLREAEPVASPAELELLLNERGRSLLDRIPGALAFLRSIGADQRLEHFSEHLTTELGRYSSGEGQRASHVFSLDALRGHVAGLLNRLEQCIVEDEALQAAERQRKRSEKEAIQPDDFSATAEAFHLQHAHERYALVDQWLPSYRIRVQSRPPRATDAGVALLGDLVEARFLERALQEGHDLDEHAILIELVRLGELSERRRFSGGSPGLLEWLGFAYASARGGLERAAVTYPDGKIEVAQSARGLEALLRRRVRAIALLVLGPSVKSFLIGETGCHVRRTAAAGPEIVRVQILKAADPAQHLASHEVRRIAFEEALEAGTALPDNPERLLPIVRSLRLEPLPERATTASLEDYRLAYTTERRVRVLSDLLRDVWYLSAGARHE